MTRVLRSRVPPSNDICCPCKNAGPSERAVPSATFDSITTRNVRTHAQTIRPSTIPAARRTVRLMSLTPLEHAHMGVCSKQAQHALSFGLGEQRLRAVERGVGLDCSLEHL